MKNKERHCLQAVSKVLGTSPNLTGCEYNLFFDAGDTKSFTQWEAAESHEVSVGGPDFGSAVSSVIINEDIQHPPATFDPSTPAAELRLCAGVRTIPHVFLHVHTDESPRQARGSQQLPLSDFRICLWKGN